MTLKALLGTVARFFGAGGVTHPPRPAGAQKESR